MPGGSNEDRAARPDRSAGGSFAGTMAVVALDATGEDRAAAFARALAAEGATVILVAGSGDRSGRLARALDEEARGRVAVFCAGSDFSADLEALAELAAELSSRT